jgi:hypothetical protein
MPSSLWLRRHSLPSSWTRSVSEPSRMPSSSWLRWHFSSFFACPRGGTSSLSVCLGLPQNLPGLGYGTSPSQGTASLNRSTKAGVGEGRRGTRAPRPAPRAARRPPATRRGAAARHRARPPRRAASIEAFFGQDDPGRIVDSRCDLGVGGVWTVDFGPRALPPPPRVRSDRAPAPPRSGFHRNAPGRIELPHPARVHVRGKEGKTLMTMTQRDFPTAELREEHERGLPQRLRPLGDAHPPARDFGLTFGTARRRNDKGERRPRTRAPTGTGSRGAAYCFAPGSRRLVRRQPDDCVGRRAGARAQSAPYRRGCREKGCLGRVRRGAARSLGRNDGRRVRC